MVAVHVVPRFVNFGLQTSEISPDLYCSEKLRGCNMFYFHSQCGSTVAMSTAGGQALFGAKYLTNGYRYGQSYYRRRIGNRTQAFEWHQLQ